MVQVHVFYSGVVQGVGFRYTVQDLAICSEIGGWVRNLRDGRVELLAEGPEEKIAELLQDIDNHFSGYIADRQIEYHPAEGQVKKFMIVH